MSKKKLVVLAAAFWAAGLGSAAALAYVVNRPPTLAPIPPNEPVATLAVVAPPPAPKPAEPTVIRLEPLVIVAHLAKPVLATSMEQPARALSDMRCANWRPLEQGAAVVRVCD